jgi:lysophospholipase L1-like esterase
MDGNPVAVTFASPTTSGGTAPVTTTCTPASGTNFALGTTAVACTARDASQQAASCGLTVTVTRVPRVAVTNFLAFGDSITEGVFGDCAGSVNPNVNVAAFAGLGLYQELLDVARSYPTKLQSMLSGRYTAQTITVKNAGKGGERADDAAARLASELSAARPGILLLQEGANNVNADDSAIFIAAALRELVKRGQSSGARVFIGTLLPQRSIASGSCLSKAPNASKVAEINQAIRTMAAGEGATLIDLYGAFGGVPDPLIGPDGLHPYETGYEKIAATFFDAIRQQLEN